MSKSRKYKYQVTMFTRLILSFTFLAVVLIGLVGGYLYITANQLMVGEIAKDSQQRLVTAQGYVENTLLKKYENGLRNTAFSTISNQNNSILSYLLASKWQGNISSIVSFRKELETFQLANEGVSNITVYFHTGNYVVNYSSFYTNPNNSPDASFINRLDQITPGKWISRTLPDETHVMTYVMALPYGTLKQWNKGYLFVDVDQEYMQTMAANILTAGIERLYMFDQAGKVIIQTANEPEELKFLQQAIASGKPLQQVHDDKRGLFIDYLRSPQGWQYVMVRPLNSFVSSGEQMKNKIFLTCLMVLLVGLLMAYMISRKFYVPLKKLVQNIKSLYQPSLPHVNDEFVMIGNTIQSLGQKIVSLESRAKQNEMKNLVLGASLGLENLDHLPQDGRYIAAYIQCNEDSMDQIEQIYNQLAKGTRQYEFVSINANETAVIYLLDTNDETTEQQLVEEMYHLKQQLPEQYRCGIAFGTFVHAAEEISISFHYAKQASRYRFFHGEEAIMLYSEITKLTSTPHLFSFEAYKNAMKAGNTHAIKQFIDDFRKTIEDGQMQLEPVELAVLQLVSTLYHVVIELGLQQTIPPSSLFDDLKKDNFEATLISIQSLSEQIAAHVRESVNHAHSGVILKLKAYIDENLHEDLSLNKLSEVASLVPSYVSTLFGEVMNESFTEYLTRTRLDKAALMLIDEINVSVAEISTRVGYRNPQYFHNKFKARFGVTPVQYRKANQKSNTTA